MVGRTPWSARVPPDPPFFRRIKCLPVQTSRPGGRLRTRGAAPPLVFALDGGKTLAQAETALPTLRSILNRHKTH